MESPVVAMSFDDDGNYELLFITHAKENGGPNGKGFWIYSTKQGEWRTVNSRSQVGVGNRVLKFERSVLIDGMIYMVSSCREDNWPDHPYIVAIDVANGTSKNLPLPPGGGALSDVDDIEIARWGSEGSSSLCLIKWFYEEDVFRMWVLEDRKSWVWSECCCEVSLESMGVEPEETVTKFTMINADTLVFVTWDVFVTGGLKQFKGTKELGYLRGSLFPYSNTLRPCMHACKTM